MRFVMFSDTHGYNDIVIPDGDVLIFAGDFSRSRGSLLQLAGFNKWLGELPHKAKLVIAGNHDFVFDTHKDLAKKLLTNAEYLEHEPFEIWDGYRTIKLFASPYHPKIWGKFELERDDLSPVWDTIPDDTKILITHGPPYGIRDESSMGVGGHVGDRALLRKVNKIRPVVHIFGHIHEGHGHSRIGNTHFFNVSICNVEYEPVNKPIVWDYE